MSQQKLKMLNIDKMRLCRECGEPFKPIKPNQRYCSACQLPAPEPISPRDCLRCGTSFTPRHRFQKYCSNKCRKYPRTGPEYTKEQLQWLEQRTRENLVLMFSDELQYTVETGKMKRTIGNVRKTMKDLGIIQIEHRRRASPFYLVSHQAQAILNDLNGSETC